MMLAMEEVLCEVSDHEKSNAQVGLPPGFRFHPTDEELITFYLASKVFNANATFSDHVNFVEVDLNRCEPWQLPEVAKMGEREWYLYSVRDRKYPTGLRTNRATGAGYWKATGKDKEVYKNNKNSISSGPLLLIGMKKTLVFYKGRAPRGEKTKWVMHEYRLDGHFSHSHSHSHSHASSSTNKEEWVICRIFHKSGEKRTATAPPLVQVQAAGGGHHHLDYPSASPITTTKAAALLASPTSSSFSLELDSHQSLSQLMMFHQQKQNNDNNNNNNNISHQHQLFPLHHHHHAFQPPPLPTLQHLSQQNCTTLNNIKVKDETTTTAPAAAVPKVTKTDHHQASAFLPPYQQLLDDPNYSNLNYWVDRLNPSSFQNSNNNNNNIPLLGDHIVDASGQVIRDMMMSSSMAFNRAAGLQQQILDAPIGMESWPHPQHV